VRGLFGCVRSSHVPGSSGAGSAAGCIHPFAWPRPWPGGMGRVRVRRAVRRGQSDGRPAARGGGGQNSLRPRAWRRVGPAAPGHGAVMAGAAAGGLARQRICPSRIP
jgi:hypothetical protein